MPTWTGTADELAAALGAIPGIIDGTVTESMGLRDYFWTCVGNAVLEQAQKNYALKLDGGVGTDGEVWAPLAKGTLKIKSRPGVTQLPWKPADILARTGHLVASLTPGYKGNRSNAPDQVFNVHTAGVEVGTEDPKADAHQAGNYDERLPARPILPADGSIPVAWEPAIEEAMAEAIGVMAERIVNAGGIT